MLSPEAQGKELRDCVVNHTFTHIIHTWKIKFLIWLYLDQRWGYISLKTVVVTYSRIMLQTKAIVLRKLWFPILGWILLPDNYISIWIATFQLLFKVFYKVSISTPYRTIQNSLAETARTSGFIASVRCFPWRGMAPSSASVLTWSASGYCTVLRSVRPLEQRQQLCMPRGKLIKWNDMHGLIYISRVINLK